MLARPDDIDEMLDGPFWSEAWLKSRFSNSAILIKKKAFLVTGDDSVQDVKAVKKQVKEKKLGTAFFHPDYHLDRWKGKAVKTCKKGATACYVYLF